MKSSRVKKALLCIAIFISSCWQYSYGQQIFLLTVGIADYPNDENDLRLPALDAKRMKWLYDKNKHAVSYLLTDSLATKERILSAMNRLYQKACPEDIIVFFFSGHGYDGAFCAYDDDISYQEVRSNMAMSKSKHKIIFADACFSGNMRKEAAQGKNDVDTDIDVMMFLSSRNNEYSIESTGMVNGYFTTALQQGLRGKADTNKDRTICAKELFSYVSNMVKDLSNDRQHPVMWGKFSDDMPIMVW